MDQDSLNTFDNSCFELIHNCLTWDARVDLEKYEKCGGTYEIWFQLDKIYIRIYIVGEYSVIKINDRIYKGFICENERMKIKKRAKEAGVPEIYELALADFLIYFVKSLNKS